MALTVLESYHLRINKGINMGEKIKYFVYALIPAIVINMIQAFAAIVVMSFRMMEQLAKEGGFFISDDPVRAMENIMGLTANSFDMDTILVLYIIMTLVVELLVVYFVFKQKSLKGNIKNVNGAAFGSITLTIIGLGIATSYILNIVNDIFPELMQKYEQIMENLGISGEVSVLSLICAVIGAPIIEELCFRYFTLHLFRKVFSNFWVANILQALIFGVIHGNIVQGTYAFCIGLVLGYIRYRYDSVYASILGHILFNFYGTIITAIISMYLADFNPVVAIIIGISILACGFYLMKPKDSARA